MFTRSSDAKLQIVEGGLHFLSASKPDVVNQALLEFVKRHSKMQKEREKIPSGNSRQQ